MIIGENNWPEAAIAIAGIAFVTVVLTAAIWQIFGTGRASIVSRGDARYRTLAERAVDVEEQTLSKLDELTKEVGELRQRTGELERMLKDVS